jgi:hypothetical protein
VLYQHSAKKDHSNIINNKIKQSYNFSKMLRKELEQSIILVKTQDIAESVTESY